MHPFRAIISNNAGIAVISLLFSPVFTGANTSRFSVAQALARWIALFPCRVFKAPPQGFSVPFDVFPAFGEGRHRQKGDDDTFDKGIAFFSLNPRVFDVVKKVDYGRYGFGDH
jgi:hypothetical protein